MKPTLRIGIRSLGIALLAGLGAVCGIGQTGLPDTAADLGVPSSISMTHSKKSVGKSLAQLAKEKEIHKLALAEAQKGALVHLASLPSASQTSVTKKNRDVPNPTRLSWMHQHPHATPNSPGAPPKTVPQQVVTNVVKTPYQTLTLTFVNPGKETVEGLHLTATIHTQDGRATDVKDLVTDKDGHIRLPKVGPLPANIDLTFVSENGEASDEWQMADEHTASLTVAQTSGQKLEEKLLKKEIMPGTRVSMQNPVQDAKVFGVNLRLAGYQTSHAKPSAPPKLPAPIHVTEYYSVVYSDSHDPIAVVHNRVDLQIQAPPGSIVTMPALPGETMTVPAEGMLTCRVPSGALRSGPVPVLVSKELSGGLAETVVTDYETDPYRPSVIHATDLRLVKLTGFQLAGAAQGLGVLDHEDAVTAKLGSASDVWQEEDGGEVHRYLSNGLEFKMRPSALTQDIDLITERVRITSAEGGSIGGANAVKVGSDRVHVQQALGKPEATGNGQDAYLNNGLFISYKGDNVQWIEIARPQKMLEQGTTAFVPRVKAKLFVSSFQGDARSGLTSLDQFKDYLRQVPSITLTDRREDADLVLEAHIADFVQTKDKVYGGMPFRYQCTTHLVYSLYDADTKEVFDNQTRANGEALADYAEQAQGGSSVLAALSGEKPNTKQLRQALGGDTGIYQLQQSMRLAAQRCPVISTRSALNTMVSEISHRAKFAVRVIGIDYKEGTLLLNAGTAEGVHASTQTNPYEFEILVGNQPLPYHEEGLAEDFYTAVVTEARDHDCTCQLRHVWRTVDNKGESFNESADLTMVKRLLAPETGLVSARAWLPYPMFQAQIDLTDDGPGAGTVRPTGFDRYVYGNALSERDYRNIVTRVVKALRSTPGALIPGSTPRRIFVQATPRVIPANGTIRVFGRPVPPKYPLPPHNPVARGNRDISYLSAGSLPIIVPRDTNKKPDVLPRDTNKKPDVLPRDTNKKPDVLPRDTNKKPDVLPRDTNKKPDVLPRDTNKKPDVLPRDTNKKPDVLPRDTNKKPDVLPRDTNKKPDNPKAPESKKDDKKKL